MTIQWYQDHILWKDGHIAHHPRCCCPLCGQAEFDEPCDPWVLASYNDVGCLVLPAFVTEGDNCDLWDFFSPVELDVELPNGWGGPGCPAGDAYDCTDQDGEILVVTVNSAGFAFGNFNWIYPPDSEGAEELCNTYPLGGTARRLWVYLECRNVAAPEEDPDYRCFLRVVYTVYGIAGGNYATYEWLKELASRLAFEEGDPEDWITLPMYDSDTDGAPACTLSGSPSIRVRRHT